MPEKFLIIQTAFIGDVVLATAIAENLHAAYPDSRIDFLLRKGNEGLLNGHPYLNEVLIWDKKKNKLLNLLKLLFRLRKNRYEKVINVQRYAATGLLTAFSGARETIGFDKNPFSFLFTKTIKHVFRGDVKSIRKKARMPEPEDKPGKRKGTDDIVHETQDSLYKIKDDSSDLNDNIHETERNNELIFDFTRTPAMKPALYPAGEDYRAVAAYKIKPYLSISPASVWFTKQYPAQKWVDFINKVPPAYTIYLLGGAGDATLAEDIRKSALHPVVINLCGRLNFLQSAALMKDALMNYVNDSAPMHFASGVNAPVAAVYCSTIPAFGYGPLSDKRFIVEKKQPLYCRPCGLHGYRACPQGHFLCAMDIRDDQLLEAIL